MKIDFSNCKNLSDCPVWWINFVMFTIKGLSTKEKNLALDRGIEKYHGAIIDAEGAEGAEDFDALEFETEDDFNAFRLYWTLHGK